MKIMTTYDFYLYMRDKLKAHLTEDEIASMLKNGYIDKKSKYAISVFQAPSSRSNSQLCIGGIDVTAVREIPINILIRWGSDARLSDEMCVKIYKSLLTEDVNITSNDVKIAYIQLLDAQPINLGRDDMNVCESSIRANVYYYI